MECFIQIIDIFKSLDALEQFVIALLVTVGLAIIATIVNIVSIKANTKIQREANQIKKAENELLVTKTVIESASLYFDHIYNKQVAVISKVEKLVEPILSAKTPGVFQRPIKNPINVEFHDSCANSIIANILQATGHNPAHQYKTRETLEEHYNIGTTTIINRMKLVKLDFLRDLPSFANEYDNLVNEIELALDKMVELWADRFFNQTNGDAIDYEISEWKLMEPIVHKYHTLM